MGLFFVPVDNPAQAVRATCMAENSPSRIIGIAPDTQNLRNKIEVRTKYADSSGVLLKSPRAITSGFILEQV